MEKQFDRIWFTIIVAVGAFVVMNKIGKLYFWIIDKTWNAISYDYLTEDHKVIQADFVEATN